MALFMLACFDKPNSLDLRMATREAHLAYVRQHIAAVKVAGPMLDEHEAMAGSLFILDVADLAAAKAFNAADPYQQAGVFERVEARGFRATIGSL
ncbi:MAG: YciI family protein [Phenylobacterium sp.]